MQDLIRLAKTIQNKTPIGVTFEMHDAIMVLGMRALTVSGCYVKLLDQTEIIFLINSPFEPFQNEAEAISVLFHELSHASGADGRLGRLVTNREAYGQDGRAIEELIAESTAMRLMETFGYATDATRAKSASYLALYARDLTTALELSQIETEVNKAFDWIMANVFQSETMAKAA